MVWKFLHMLMICVHIICSQLWLLHYGSWGSELNLVRSFKHYACNFLVKLLMVVTTTNSIARLIFMRCNHSLSPKLYQCGQQAVWRDALEEVRQRQWEPVSKTLRICLFFFQIMSVYLCLMGISLYVVIIRAYHLLLVDGTVPWSTNINCNIYYTFF